MVGVASQRRGARRLVEKLLLTLDPAHSLAAAAGILVARRESHGVQWKLAPHWAL